MNPFNNAPFSANHAVVQRQTENLPVRREIPRLLAALNTHNVLVVVGETGSGKTTILPMEIVRASMVKGKLAVTQNKRLATQLVCFLSRCHNIWACPS